jgi:hypothetical protein
MSDDKFPPGSVDEVAVAPEPEEKVDHRKIWGAGYHTGYKRGHSEALPEGYEAGVKAGREEVMRMGAKMLSGMYAIMHHIETFNYADHWEDATASMCVCSIYGSHFEEFDNALCDAGLFNLIDDVDYGNPKKITRYVDWEKSQRPRVRVRADCDVVH